MTRLNARVLRLALAIPAAVLLLGTGGDSSPDFGEPLAGLSSAELARFDAGKEDFAEIETISDGLGPVFNAASCATCHAVPAAGGGSELIETRYGRLVNGAFDPLSSLGGTLVHAQGIGAVGGDCYYTGETVPSVANVVAGRRSTPLFGLGLVDAVPDATFQAIAAEQSGDSDGIAGLVSVVTSLSTGLRAVGKFGWKGQRATLHDFAGDAYLNEMGITSPQFPSEICPQGDCSALACNPAPGLNDDGTDIQKAADFMTFLAAPPRGPSTAASATGEQTFERVGCAGCHRPTLKTGANAVAALDRVTFHPYSDFLLHDMGSLGDGITQNQATGNLMRTAPLWGVRKVTRLLHDGRAATLEEAILAHDGQAKKSRDRFVALPLALRTSLIQFLGTL